MYYEDTLARNLFFEAFSERNVTHNVKPLSGSTYMTVPLGGTVAFLGLEVGVGAAVLARSGQ